MRRGFHGGAGHARATAWGGSSAFSPTTLGGLQLWLRGDKGTTIATGVSTWADQSVGGNNATQATGAKQPTYATPLLSSDGTKALQLDQQIVTGAMTLAVDFKFDSVPVGIVSLLTLTMSATKTFFELVCVPTGAPYTKLTWIGKVQASTAGVGFTPTLDTSNHRLIITYTGGTNTDTAQYTALFDGASQTVSASSNIARTATDLGSLFARLDSTGAVSSGATMSMRELVLCNRVLSTTEIAQLDSYMATNAP